MAEFSTDRLPIDINFVNIAKFRFAQLIAKMAVLIHQFLDLTFQLMDVTVLDRQQLLLCNIGIALANISQLVVCLHIVIMIVFTHFHHPFKNRQSIQAGNHSSICQQASGQFLGKNIFFSYQVPASLGKRSIAMTAQASSLRPRAFAQAQSPRYSLHFASSRKGRKRSFKD
ncbi:MAG: hypothetical protein Q4A11_04785 [Brachymonas sp.]|nr:hypothetical protein [Brachymonas sp.]